MAFETYELDNLDIIPVLFQTGYLTIKEVEVDGDLLFFTLSYPNWEVKNAFMTYLLNAYNNSSPTLTESHLRHLIRALRAKELKRFFEILNILYHLPTIGSASICRDEIESGTGRCRH